MTRATARRYRSDACLSEALKILAAGLIALSAAGCSLTYGIAGIEEFTRVKSVGIRSRSPQS